MSPTSFSRCILLILLFTTCALIVHGKGGRGGGGSRGGGSRGGGRGRSSSSRSSLPKYGSSSSSSGLSPPKIDYSPFSSSASYTPPKIPDFKAIDALIAQRRPQINEAIDAHQRVVNYQNFKQAEANRRMQQQAEGRRIMQQIQRNQLRPMTSFGSSQHRLVSQGIPDANYPKQQISFHVIPKHGVSITNYPRPPSPQQTLVPSGTSTFQGIPHANYPKQSILPNPSIHSPSSSSISNANYPRQQNPHQDFGIPSQQGFPNANYPRQAINPNPSVPLVRSPPLEHQLNQPGQASGLHSQHSGISSANYPRQQYNHQSLPPQVLGSGVWNPKSGMPAPVYMNYGGLPTGANMYTKPIKKQGFLGSLMSMGGSSKSYKNKHYASYPSPYGLGGGMPANVMGGFMGNKGSKTAMYTILPYMAARKSSKLFKPKFGFYGYRPIGHHFYHQHSYVHDPEYARVHYDVYNNEYVGRCNRPINPDHAKVVCNSTHNQVDCGVTCEEGYRYPDNTTIKTNKCWHVSGTWNPTKNFPGCKPVCDKPCLNGGKCVSPGVCGCSSEYRGPHCEIHFLNCDIRKLANGTKILWVCTHAKNETSCRVKCKPPAKFVPQSELLYKCTPGGVWTPSTMPPCVVPPGPEEQHVKIPEEHVTRVTA